MKDPFFNQNAVTYTGQTLVDGQFVEVVQVLTSNGVLCTIELDTVIPDPDAGPVPVAGILMGPITQDGTMCDFAGTTFQLTFPIPAMVVIVSGKATLSSNGQVLTLSDIVVIPEQPTTIPGISCNCESVGPN